VESIVNSEENKNNEQAEETKTETPRESTTTEENPSKEVVEVKVD